MLSFLGLHLHQPISNKQRYRQALQQIRHLLSFKQGPELHQTDFLITIANGHYSLQLPKHPSYLHSCHFNLPILHQHDLQFLDTCYECLMIIRQGFPSKISIEIVAESDSKQLQAFEERKKEEFNRRVNASLKNMIDSKKELDSDEVEDIMYLLMNNYNRKNKAAALKLLITRINSCNLGPFPQEYLDVLPQLQQQQQFKKSVMELTTKIKGLQRQQNVNKQNSLRTSNVYHQDQNIKINPLIFQLKQSLNLERICSLLGAVLAKENDRNFISKMESSIVLISNRFLSNEYDQMALFARDLSELLRLYWEKRGKKWEIAVREDVERKVKQLGSSRLVQSKSRSPFSRKFIQ